MKKVGIVTLSGNENYGNRLQNYALQETIKSLGGVPETIWVNNYSINPIKKNIKKIYYRLKYKNRSKLETNIKKFTKKYINGSPYVIESNKDLRFLNGKYDRFVVGSDQVWNYTSGFMNDYYFLSFSDYKKNTAYAPSFSVDSVENNWKKVYKNWLTNIKNISVRENKGKEIVKEILNVDVPVVLDPTMLISAEDWRKIEEKPKFNTEKYILTYFLGGISPENRAEIENIALKNNLIIIDLMDFNKKSYLVGVNEFLYLFDHAEIIFTDSFHACVFSIIFNKPFFVFERIYNGKSMNSRLDTLLKTFNQEFRKVSSLKKEDNIFECDFTEINMILQKKRKESLAFLEKSLELDGDI